MYPLFIHIITMKISPRNLSVIALGAALASTLALAGTAFAAAPVGGMMGGFARGGATMPSPAVVGTVASISGMTLTVNSRTINSRTGRMWHATTTPTVTPVTTTTYMVDATSATVTKAGAASTISAIAVGDLVMVQGTVSGTNVVATKINDSQLMDRGEKVPGKKPMMGIASHTPAIKHTASTTIEDRPHPLVIPHTATTSPTLERHSMMENIGGFFSRMFGFF